MMTATFRIDYIELPSSNGAASGAFFKSAFGWGLTDFGPVYTGIDGAGLDGGIDASSERVSAPMPVIRTEDLDEAERRVRDAGGTITREQFDFPAGAASTSASRAAAKWPSIYRANSRQ